MSTPDYYSSIIQQLWFISKVQLYLDWKHWNVQSQCCERAMSDESAHTVRIKLVIFASVYDVLFCAVLCYARLCDVRCFVVLCSVFFILFACSMYWDACIRSPSIHMLCVMSSFKRFAIAFCALLSNLNDTEKAMAHNTQQQCKYSWRVQRMQSPGDIERNSMEKRAQRIVISEHESKKKEKNTKNRKKEQTNGDNYYVLCARRAKQ